MKITTLFLLLFSYAMASTSSMLLPSGSGSVLCEGTPSTSNEFFSEEIFQNQFRSIINSSIEKIIECFGTDISSFNKTNEYKKIQEDFYFLKQIYTNPLQDSKTIMMHASMYNWANWVLNMNIAFSKIFENPEITDDRHKLYKSGWCCFTYLNFYVLGKMNVLKGDLKEGYKYAFSVNSKDNHSPEPLPGDKLELISPS